MNLSIKDIARKAKVATSTVSRVLNGSPLVKDTTRQHVLKIIEKYNYKPNAAARSLITGKSNLLTMVIPDATTFFSSFYFRQILYGITGAVAQAGYRLTIHQADGYDPKTGYAPTLNGIEGGIFIVAPLLQDRLVSMLESGGKPAVLISSRSSKLDWVDTDNAGAVSRVVEGLWKLGHRRMAFVGGVADTENTRARLDGYRQGLEHCGIVYDEKIVRARDYLTETGAEFTAEFLKFPDPPTAVICGNDILAMGAIQAVKRSGRSVPEDISVFGFDDSELADLSSPALSTVRQPFLDMGRAAVEMLAARLENPEAPQAVKEFECEIITRESCAVMRGGAK